MVLVSHDMRLISQVAQEIWLCDHQTVTKFVGEISDFKMQLRGQMQKQNLIDGGGDSSTSSSSSNALSKQSGKPSNLVPLTPMNRNQGMSTSTVQMNTKLTSSAFDSKKELTEEEQIIKSRLELAELAIARQKARQEEEAAQKKLLQSGTVTAAVTASANTG